MMMLLIKKAMADMETKLLQKYILLVPVLHKAAHRFTMQCAKGTPRLSGC